mgnify:CR=1 FL=1
MKREIRYTLWDLCWVLDANYHVIRDFINLLIDKKVLPDNLLPGKGKKRVYLSKDQAKKVITAWIESGKTLNKPDRVIKFMNGELDYLF